MCLSTVLRWDDPGFSRPLHARQAFGALADVSGVELEASWARRGVTVSIGAVVAERRWLLRLAAVARHDPTRNFYVRVLVLPLIMWPAFLLGRQERDNGLGGFLARHPYGSGPFLSIRSVTHKDMSTPKLCVGFGAAAATIVYAFSSTYFHIGTADNFNVALSKVDCVYFTLGTLSTAGTGRLQATSATAELVVSIQLVIDLIFVVVAVGLLLARLTSVLASTSPESTDD